MARTETQSRATSIIAPVTAITATTTTTTTTIEKTTSSTLAFRPSPSPLPPPPPPQLLRGRSSSRWEAIRPVMGRLYMDEQRPLKEVMAILRDEHDFSATVRSFKRHIAEWGWHKNIRLQQGADDLAVHEATVAARCVVVGGSGGGSGSGSGSGSSGDVGFLPCPLTPRTIAQDGSGSSSGSSRESGGGASQPQFVRLASGQVVNIDRLTEHIRRKRQKKEQQQLPQQGRLRRRQQQQQQLITTTTTTTNDTTTHPPHLHYHPLLPPPVRAPDALRAYEQLFAHSRRYTYARHGATASSVRAAASSLARDRAAARRWAAFADAVQDELVGARGDVGAALRRMRAAPGEVAHMVRARPATVLCSLFMFVLQVSAGWGVAAAVGGGRRRRGSRSRAHGNSDDDDDDNNNSSNNSNNQPVAQFSTLLKALFRYAASLASSASPSQQQQHIHSFPQIMRALASVPEADLSEVAFRSWAVTCHSWVTLVSPGDDGGVVGGLAVPARCIRRWLDDGDKGNMMLVMSDVLEESSRTCDVEYGKSHEKSIMALQHRADLLAWAATEQAGGDPFRHPGLVELYREILDRGARGASRDKALEFFAQGRQSVLEAVENSQRHLLFPPGGGAAHI